MPHTYYVQCSDKFEPLGAVVYRSIAAARRDYLKIGGYSIDKSRAEKSRDADKYCATLTRIETAKPMRSGYYDTAAEVFAKSI